MQNTLDQTIEVLKGKQALPSIPSSENKSPLRRITLEQKS